MWKKRKKKVRKMGKSECMRVRGKSVCEESEEMEITCLWDSSTLWRTASIRSLGKPFLATSSSVEKIICSIFSASFESIP